jgi:hypothetical protein
MAQRQLQAQGRQVVAEPPAASTVQVASCNQRSSYTTVLRAVFLSVSIGVVIFAIASMAHGSRADASSVRPSAPTDVRATDESSSIRVSFKRPVRTGAGPIIKYAIWPFPSPYQYFCRSTSCSITGLEPGVATYFKVRAINRYGPGPFSVRSNVVIPSQPTTTTTSTTTTTTMPPVVLPTATLELSESSVPSSGGNVTLTYASTNATTCSLSSVPSLWTSGSTPVECNGSYLVKVVPASQQQEWVFTFTATSSGNESASASQRLIQEAPPQPAAHTSDNWAGYVVPSESALITDAEGTWTVPSLNCADTPNGGAFIWVGIGGEQWPTGGSSGTLLQTGVDVECVDGVQQNDGWWEDWPSTPNESRTFESFPVAVGDVIDASVYQTTSGSWETCLSDVTDGLSGIMVTGEGWGVSNSCLGRFSYQGTTTDLSYSGGYTAEWIVEDYTDTATNQVHPFASFSVVTFSDLLCSLTDWSLTQSETWAIVQNGVTLATPTASSTDGFTISYTGP